MTALRKNAGQDGRGPGTVVAAGGFMEFAGERSRAGPSGAQTSRPPLQVLLVEKDTALSAAFTRRLGTLDCDVEQVQNAEAALQALEEDYFDLLIANWDAPGVSRSGFFSRVREIPDRHIQIILITNLDDTQALQTALDSNVDGLLQKPFSWMHVAFVIANAKRVLDMQKRLIEQNALLVSTRKEAAGQLARIRSDLEAAAELQRGVLPTPITSGPFRLASFFQPSDEISGDVLGAQTLEDGSLLFFNVDVAGHGVPAAIEAFALHSRLAFPPPETPERLQFVAGRLNAELLSRDGRCATMVLGLLTADGRQVTMVRAGHPHPLLVPARGPARYIHQGGLPLGVLPGSVQPLVQVTLDPGDRLIIYSDGVIDGNGDRGGLGNDGFSSFWVSQQGQPIEKSIEELELKLQQANRNKPPTDDISVMVIERAP